MSETNIAAVLHKEHDVRIEKRTIPLPGKNEVQIRMRYVGVCGSDIHFWQDCRVGDMFFVKAPLIQGHECSGVISKVGDGVTHLKEGDRVAIEPARVCHNCEACISGRYNLCEKIYFFSIPPHDGGLSQYVVHPAEFLTKLPDNMSLEEGALAEPLSVGLYGCRRTRVSTGDKVLISGAGPIGLCTLMSAQFSGATHTVVTDPIKSRLDLAKKLGATHTLQISEDTKPEEVAEQIRNMLGSPPNKALDCSGAQHAVHVAVNALKPGCVLGLVGLGETNMSVPMVKIIAKELELVGNVLYTNTWPTAIEMIASGKCDVSSLVSHRYTIEETQKAFEMAHSHQGMKVMIDCNPE